jgi:hypothetical protein
MAERRVRIQVPMAGGTFNYAYDDEVVLEEELAIALCTEPADAPRAKPVGWEIDSKGRATATREKREKATNPVGETRKTSAVAATTPPKPDGD